MALCSSKENYLFVGDLELNEILKFDNKLRLIQKSKIESNIKPNYLEYDDESKLLYMSDYNGNKIHCYDNNLNKINSAHIDLPCHLKICDKSLLVIGWTKFSETKDNKFLSFEKGENCIYDLDKRSLIIENKIKLKIK